MTRTLNHILEDIFLPVYDINKYPPYNIVSLKEGHTVIQLAVAGFSAENLEVTLEGKTLTISGSMEVEEVKYVYKGISSKKFSKAFTVQESTEVTSVFLKNGLLTVELRTNKVAAEKKKFDIK